MNQQQLKQFQQSIEQANGMGSELLNKREFDFLIPYFFNDESVNSLAVGQILENLYLLCLTNQRLFLVEKNELNIFQLKRMGLEEIVGLDLKTDLGNQKIKLTLLNDEQIIISGINEQKAKAFVQNLANCIKQWTSSLK